MSHFEKWHRPIRRFCIPFMSCPLVFSLLVVSCHDKGVEPNGVPIDYRVYFSSETTGSPKLFAFHTTTLAIDSTSIPFGSLGGVTVSANGDRLYINDGIKVHVLDASTLEVITELPYPSLSPVAVSPDDRLVAITGNDLTIFRTSDYSVVFSDTDITRQGMFSSDSRVFFCPAGESSLAPRVVYSVDLAHRPYRVNHKAFSDGSVAEVVPSHDNAKWFMYLRIGTLVSAFEVYDVRADSVIFRTALRPGSGRLVLTPDNRYVFYTNPGGGLIGPPPPSGFSVYDVRANTAREIIDTSFFDGVYGDSVAWWSPPTYLAVTPDGRWLVMMSGMMTAQAVYLWDISAERPVYRWMGYTRQFYNLSVRLTR
jgi:hypothetical protein